MKKDYYIVETKNTQWFRGDTVPFWYNDSVHNSLKAALARKAELLEFVKKEDDGSFTKRWRAKEIRIIECTRKVIR